jgi:predicted transglutaminase-like cysteine proteinase
MDTKYPEVNVSLVGEDGNAFAILGRVQKALRRAGVPKEELDAYVAEATSGDYNHLLRVTMNWVEVD